MPMSRALSTLASVPPIRSETRAAMWRSPRCSRSMLAACQSRATGSSGIVSARRPAYMIRGSVGAPVEAWARELGGERESRRLDAVAENPPQRRDASLLTRGVCRLRCGGVPHLGDVAGHLTLGGVVEGSVDHLTGGAAERGGAAPEGAVPIVAEAERRHRALGSGEKKLTRQIDSVSSKGRRATGSGCCICVVTCDHDGALMAAAHHRYERVDRHTTKSQRPSLAGSLTSDPPRRFASSSGTSPSNGRVARSPMRRVNLGLTRLRMRPVRRLARATSGGAPRPTGRTRCGSSPVLVGLLEVGLEDVRKGWARGACR